MVNITITLAGEEITVARLRHAEIALTNFSRLWPKMRAIFRDVTRAAFMSEGVTTQGGAWQKLKPATIKDRIRRGFAQGPILQRTGTLRKAVTNATMTTTETSARFHVDSEYFVYHQSLEPRAIIPRRPVLDLTQDDRRAFRNEVLVYVGREV